MSVKKSTFDVYPGAVIGRWTVTDKYIKSPKGENKVLCQCECGTERYVLERSLKYGGSLSCGCLTRENAQFSNSKDLTGQRFGELTVVNKAVNQKKNGGIWWTCSCSCGNTCDVPATLLVTGRKRHCGCKSSKNYYYVDISGQKFNMLTALYRLDERTKKGSIIWHCRCDCGNEVDVSYNELLYSNVKSCGCKRKELDSKLHSLLTHIDGTSLDMLKSNKIPTNNTTGAKGVYFIKGKWVAKIVFKKKQYYLGKFDNFDDAVLARKEAEKIINDGTVEHYKRWKQKADIDPQWAEENPIQINVNKSLSGELTISFLPDIPNY